MTKEELEIDNKRLDFNEKVQLEKLEKENAELKAVNRMALYSKMSDRLAKAKEIIADIIKFQPYINRDTMFLSIGNDWKEVIYKAEQFLKESEIKSEMFPEITLPKGSAELEKENAELKEVHESDKRSLALIAKKGADFEKAYNEAEELLDKQIEATYKVFEENKELKEKLKPENCLKLLAKEGYIKFSSEQLTKAKNHIHHLLVLLTEGKRSYAVIDEARAFLKECE